MTIKLLFVQVVRQLEKANFSLDDLHVQDLTKSDYPALINGAASGVLEVVDACVAKFGREAVLY